MKTTSRLALVAAAGLLIGAVSPATAADLKGGGCCADLEERVAELEATTARKGNRVVSLQIYGQVNKALMIWDDGVDSDAFVVDNETSGSRIGLTGKATLKPGWSAGFLMEFDYQDSSSDQVLNVRGGDDGGDGDDNQIIIRHNNLWIESERLGRLTIGQGSTAADGAAGVNLANSLRGAASDQGSDFEVRLGNDGFSGITLDEFVFDLDGPREDVVRYDSPSIYGFILSATWGDDDYADIALRFKKEFNSIRLAAAVSYAWDDRVGDTDGETTILVGSASVMHVPTGLFLTAAAGNAEVDGFDGELSYWYLQGGIEKKWLPYGATTLYAEYGDYENDLSLDEGEATRWGFGVVQKFDSAAMEIYAQATFYDFEVNGNDDLEDMSTLLIGSRIKF